MASKNLMSMKVQRVEVAESGRCAKIWIQPGAIGTGVDACYSRNDNDQRDSSTTPRHSKIHLYCFEEHADIGR